MPHYLTRFRYAPDAIRDLIERPDEDHAAGAAGLIASLGGKLTGYWYALGAFDGVALFEATDASTAAAIAMAVGGSGETAQLETTALLTMDEARAAMRKAGTATHLPRAVRGRPS